ncbi:MAG: class I SAM-dependent methyltransferase [Myxococcales bacterium]|nr:class I SAM-dependent methyltransferase [Myxococcales bacterium]
MNSRFQFVYDNPDSGKFPPYSDDFMRALAALLKSHEGTPEFEQWFLLNLTRVADKRRNLIPALTRYTTLADKEILEIGCGLGPGTVALAEQGARVTALDVDAKVIETARLRVRDHGFADRAQVMHVPNTRHLPFADQAFDLIVCNGVMEHVLPSLRHPLLNEMWRVLKPGGLLFIGETPNRLWPIDGHTTGLWWIHYLPLPLAAWYAKARHRIRPVDDLNELGGLGCTYGTLVRALPRRETDVLNLRPPYSWISRHRTVTGGRPIVRLGKKCLIFSARLTEQVILHPLFHRPIDMFFPYLTLGVQKKSPAQLPGQAGGHAVH